MLLIELKNIEKAFGEIPIINGVSFQVGLTDKIGLVGANGCGKTTLLNITAGKYSPDRGKVIRSRGLVAGYLSQTPPVLNDATLRALLKESVAHVFQLRDELARLEKEMADPGVNQNEQQLHSIVEKYGRLSVEYELKRGYHIEAKIEEVAKGLGFSSGAMSRPLQGFSGGEKTRAQLAALLLQEPDILLLDEPTNNLDTSALNWLENYLKNWRGAILVVSHDRLFLDRVTSKTAFLNEGRLMVYNGNYSFFSTARRIEEEVADKATQKEQAILKKDKEFILNASSEEKRRAQSREKQLARSGEKDGGATRTTSRRKTMKARFGYAGRSGREVLAFYDVEMSYGKNHVFQGANFRIYQGERVAITGPNGAGKTTLLRLMASEQDPSRGKVDFGTGVKVSYFAQEQEQLDFSGTILDNILGASNLTIPEARSFLGRYLFRGDDVFKITAHLSVGERSRLALAIASLSEGNLLLLDEPTNYLDIQALESLEEALNEYPGTLVVVSHDRYFLSRLAGSVLEVKGGLVKYIPVPYKDYLEKMGQNGEETSNSRKGLGLPGEAGSNNPQKEREKQERRILREKEKLEKQCLLEYRRKKRGQEQIVDKLEARVQEAESRVGELEKRLADPQVYDNFEIVRTINQELNEARLEARESLNAWEEAAFELEQMEIQDEKEIEEK